MKILVIALHKLGDNLQVTPVFRVLKERHPGARVDVLTEPKFRFAFDGNPCIDQIHLFDRTQYSGQSVTSLETGRSEMCPVLKALQSEAYDLLVNRQSSVEGAVIAALVAPLEYRGIYMQPDNRVAVVDPWTRLLFTACRNRHVNPFNFVDYGINMAGNGAGERRLELHADRAPGALLLHRLGLTQGPIIALQPGSTSPMRRWPTAHFSDMARRLLCALPEARCLILGAPSEAPLAHEITAALPELSGKRLMDLTHDLPLASLPGVLARCSLLVTNDTGPMHIAAAVKCPVIALYFGESFVHETGPYGDNHHVVHARLDCLPCTFDKPCLRGYECQKVISPVAIADLARSVLTGQPPEEPLFKDVVVYRSVTSRPPLLQERGEGGEVSFRPLFKRPASANDIHRVLYFKLFRSYLHDLPFNPETIAEQLSDDYTDVSACVNAMADLDISLITQFAQSDVEAVTLRDRFRDGFLFLRQETHPPFPPLLPLDSLRLRSAQAARGSREGGL
ncbi:MAG: glycosyltransferase family 9 protein [Fibrobacterota bacterium]